MKSTVLNDFAKGKPGYVRYFATYIGGCDYGTGYPSSDLGSGPYCDIAEEGTDLEEILSKTIKAMRDDEYIELHYVDIPEDEYERGENLIYSESQSDPYWDYFDNLDEDSTNAPQDIYDAIDDEYELNQDWDELYDWADLHGVVTDFDEDDDDDGEVEDTVEPFDIDDFYDEDDDDDSAF